MMNEPAAVAGKSLRLAHGHPIGGTVTGAAELLPVHEAFRPPHRHAVLLEPVVSESTQALAEDRRGQVAHPHPRQHQKPDAINQMLQPTSSLRGVPTDKSVSAAELSHRRLPSQHRQQLPFASIDQILQIGSDQPRRAQIVMSRQQLTPQLALGRGAYPFHPQRTVPVQLAVHRRPLPNL